MLWTDLNQPPQMHFPHVCPLLTRVVVLTPVKRWGSRKAGAPALPSCCRVSPAAGLPVRDAQRRAPEASHNAGYGSRTGKMGVWVPGC